MPGSSPDSLAVYIGRFSPLHKGHQRVFDYMIEKHGAENVLTVVGSINSLSYKNIFPPATRIEFIKRLYPDIKVIGYPDIHSDNIWFRNLLHTIEQFYPGRHIRFYSGARGDIYWLEQTEFSPIIIDRFIHEISGTKVRDYLWEGKDISHLVDEDIHDDIVEVYRDRISWYSTKPGWTGDEIDCVDLPENDWGE